MLAGEITCHYNKIGPWFKQNTLLWVSGSVMSDSATPWTAAHQASLSASNSPVIFSDGYNSVEKLNQESHNSHQNFIVYFAFLNLVNSLAVFLI